MTEVFSGRKAQAARNDEAILAAARAVFVADPSAPVAAVADRAGVGISALYRRYRSKDELLQTLCGDALEVFIAIAESAESADTDTDGGDPWETFANFIRRVVEADTHSLTVALAGTFQTTERLSRRAVYSGEVSTRIVARAHAAGVIRPDLEVGDLGMLFEQLAAVRGPDEARTAQLRRRYVELLLDGVRHHGPTLPGPAPQLGEFAHRWVVPLASTGAS